jgi:hypothetical protein
VGDRYDAIGEVIQWQPEARNLATQCAWLLEVVGAEWGKEECVVASLVETSPTFTFYTLSPIFI